METMTKVGVYVCLFVCVYACECIHIINPFTWDEHQIFIRSIDLNIT